jgi:predicted acyltransferase
MCFAELTFFAGFFQPILGDIVRALPQDNICHIVWKKFHSRRMGRITPLGYDYASVFFMAGVSIPFALAKYMRGEVSLQKMGVRIGKRVILLFVFGAIVQGVFWILI